MKRLGNSRMTRGRFLGLTALGGALMAAASATLGWRSFRHARPEDIEKVVRDGLPYLDLQVSQEEFRAFGATYLEHWPVRIFREPRQFIQSTFLLSTDFFVHGADVSRPVRFVRFHNPYISPCWNPIVRR